MPASSDRLFKYWNKLGPLKGGYRICRHTALGGAGSTEVIAINSEDHRIARYGVSGWDVPNGGELDAFFKPLLDAAEQRDNEEKARQMECERRAVKEFLDAQL